MIRCTGKASRLGLRHLQVAGSLRKEVYRSLRSSARSLVRCARVKRSLSEGASDCSCEGLQSDREGIERERYEGRKKNGSFICRVKLPHPMAALAHGADVGYMDGAGIAVKASADLYLLTYVLLGFHLIV
jgi:hypothetical protein